MKTIIFAGLTVLIVGMGAVLLLGQDMVQGGALAQGTPPATGEDPYNGQSTTEEGADTGDPSPTTPSLLDENTAFKSILVAVEDIPRGDIVDISTSLPVAVIQPWPLWSLPEEGQYIEAEDLESIDGLMARADIPRGTPILRTFLTDDEQYLAAVGSDLALLVGQTESGSGAFGVPLDLSQSVVVPLDLAAFECVDVLVEFEYGQQGLVQQMLARGVLVAEYVPEANALTLTGVDPGVALEIIWAQDSGLPLYLSRSITPCALNR
ncbi:MAG: hypothetical protein GYB65_05610 [Chloroflexi bacterium]|nr:hypothetical protein [Chloroflexota bacterium]